VTTSPASMRAVQLSAPGPVDNLRLITLPLPPERAGWVRIRVEAFGLNRAHRGGPAADQQGLAGLQ
jgi:NADPH:quinone reductase